MSVINKKITDIVMGTRWKEDELMFIKSLYESGKTLNEVFQEFVKQFGNNRTEGAVWLVIKRHKYRHTVEQKRKIKSDSHKGEKNGMFGKSSWCAGLTKETSEKIAKRGKKLSATRKLMFEKGLLDISGDKNGMFGKDPWNKGESTETNSIVKRIGEKISKFRIHYWNSITQEQRDEIIGKLSKGANKRKNNTSIERIVKQALEDLSINFVQQHRCSRFVLDFYLPDFNFVIECQGDYWHANPDKFQTLNEVQRKNRERDAAKIEFLENAKIGYLFLWESEIHKNFENLKEQIKNAL